MHRARRSRLVWWVVGAIVVSIVALLRFHSSAPPAGDAVSASSDSLSEEGATEDSAPEVVTGLAIPVIESLESTDPAMAQVVRDAIAAVRRNPEDGQTWGRLGRIYDAHRYVDLAARCYERAIELSPQEAAWHYYLATFAIDSGRYDEAVKYLEATIERNADYLPAYYHLGTLFLEAGRIEPARRAFDEVVSRAPEQPWGYLGQGKIAYRERHLEEAAELFERALELEPRHRETAYLLAMTDQELGRDELAAALLAELAGRREVLMDDPYLLLVVEQRSDLQEKLETANRFLSSGQLSAAEEIYREVLSFDADNFDAHHNLGVLCGQSGRLTEAEAEIEKAKALRPNSAAVHFSLAMVFASTDRRQQAVAELRRALELDPGHAEAQRSLAALTTRP